MVTGLGYGDGQAVADRFGLGAHAVLTGPAAHSLLGPVRRLTTDRGDWAVKESFRRSVPANLERVAAFEEAAFAAGVAMPQPIRTRDGDILAEIVAAIHRVHHHTRVPVDAWYSQPVGAATWDDIIGRLRRAAPTSPTSSARCATNSSR